MAFIKLISNNNMFSTFLIGNLIQLSLKENIVKFITLFYVNAKQIKHIIGTKYVPPYNLINNLVLI